VRLERRDSRTASSRNRRQEEPAPSEAEAVPFHAYQGGQASFKIVQPHICKAQVDEHVDWHEYSSYFYEFAILYIKDNTIVMLSN
jgi:hypothetical protein